MPAFHYFCDVNEIRSILVALLIPLAGTILGSAFVFFMKKEIPARLQKALLGFASGVTPAMPYLLSFAAGAMLYVVIEELIPETSQGAHSNIGTIGFALGFALMMVLDVVMG